MPYEINPFSGEMEYVARTKSDVGLNNVDNTSDVNKPVSTAQAIAISNAQTAAQNYADTKDSAHVAALDPHPQYETSVEAQAKVDLHANRTDNPHSVTKTQVGLGNVDNTSDLNKPISTATQNALNLKYDSSNPNGYETPTQLDARDVANRNRANHTGTQLASTISNFNSQVDSRITLQKGVAGGIATLDVNGFVSAAQLPSYVDDVLEYANLASFPVTGESGKIYVALDNGKIYRWSGSAYVEISPSPGSTDSVPEGATNLYFTVARVRATLLAGLSLVTGGVIASGDTVIQAFGKLQNQITNITTTLLTGLSTATGGSIAATDSILSAFGKLQNQITNITTTLLTGLSVTSGVITASDSILSAFGKLQNQITNILSTVLTGFAASTDTTVAATDTLLQALQKLQAQVTARVPVARTVSAGYGLTGGGALSANITLAALLSSIRNVLVTTVTTTSSPVAQISTASAPPAGRYLVIVTARCEAIANNSAGYGQIYLDAAGISGTLRTFGGVASGGGGLGGSNATVRVNANYTSFDIVTLNGSQNVSGRFAHTSGKFNIIDRALFLIKLGDT